MLQLHGIVSLNLPPLYVFSVNFTLYLPLLGSVNDLFKVKMDPCFVNVPVLVDIIFPELLTSFKVPVIESRSIFSATPMLQAPPFDSSALTRNTDGYSSIGSSVTTGSWSAAEATALIINTIVSDNNKTILFLILFYSFPCSSEFAFPFI